MCVCFSAFSSVCPTLLHHSPRARASRRPRRGFSDASPTAGRARHVPGAVAPERAPGGKPSRQGATRRACRDGRRELCLGARCARGAEGAPRPNVPERRVFPRDSPRPTLGDPLRASPPRELSGTSLGQGPEGTDEVPNLKRKGCRARQRTSFRIGVPITRGRDRGRDRARSRVVIRRAASPSQAPHRVFFHRAENDRARRFRSFPVFRGVLARARFVTVTSLLRVASSHAPPRRCPRA